MHLCTFLYVCTVLYTFIHVMLDKCLMGWIISLTCLTYKTFGAPPLMLFQTRTELTCELYWLSDKFDFLCTQRLSYYLQIFAEKFRFDLWVTLTNNLLAAIGPTILIFNIVHRNWWLPVFIFDASSKLAHPSFFLVCLSRDIGIIPSSFQYHRLLVVLMFWLLFSSTT